MFAIVDIAGFQEKVKEGDKLRVPSLPEEAGGRVAFKNVLLISKEGEDVKIGMPFVSGASVEARVLEHGKADKVRIVKMHRRKRYRRVRGHRQGYSDIEVTKIDFD